MTKYSREKRISACADYLLGEKLVVIANKHNIKSKSTVYTWMRKVKEHFLLRKKSRFESRGRHRNRSTN